MVAKIKKNKAIFIIAFVLIVTIGTSCFISYAKFGVVNPLSTGLALVKVMFTDTEYIEVQEYPKVIIAKPHDAKNNLIKYMRSKGFDEDESNSMGALMRFENEFAAQYVLFSVNGYFSKNGYGVNNYRELYSLY